MNSYDIFSTLLTIFVYEKIYNWQYLPKIRDQCFSNAIARLNKHLKDPQSREKDLRDFGVESFWKNDQF